MIVNLRRSLLPLSDLCLVTALNSADRPSGATRLATNEIDTIFFFQKCVGRLASFAGNVFDWRVVKIFAMEQAEVAHQCTAVRRSLSVSVGSDP